MMTSNPAWTQRRASPEPSGPVPPSTATIPGDGAADMSAPNLKSMPTTGSLEALAEVDDQVWHRAALADLRPIDWMPDRDEPLRRELFRNPQGAHHDLWTEQRRAHPTS